MRRVLSLGVLWLGLVALGCTQSGGDAPPANPKGPSAAPAAGSAEPKAAAAGALSITPENSKIEFVGSKAKGKHIGGFKQFSGTIDLVPGDLTASRISVDIDMNSTWTDTQKLTNHLLTADFFEVRTYPKATFVTTSIRPSAGGEATHEITGDLTLHGMTKAITFPAKLALTDDALTLDSKFTISRKEFGINYRPEQIYDAVALTVSVRAPRK
jgi:polyisoprenoid-binding protein YceI